MWHIYYKLSAVDFNVYKFARYYQNFYCINQTAIILTENDVVYRCDGGSKIWYPL